MGNFFGPYQVAPGGGGSSPTNTYFSGFMPNATTWSTTSATFADPTNSGNNTLTSRNSNAITVTAAASNLPGLTWSPSSASAVYVVAAIFTANPNGNFSSYRLYDGTNVISTAEVGLGTGNYGSIHLSGIWVPGTSSSSTIKIQAATVSAGSAATINAANGIANSIEWSVFEIT
jgi:hypothetical protein